MEVFRVVVGAIQENCYLLASAEKNAALVDPGDDAQRIAKAVEEQGLTVKQIWLTHGHFDHIGAVKELAKKYGAKVYASKLEEKLLGSSQLNRAGFRYGDDQRFQVVADHWLEDGDILRLDELEAKVMATPGHSAGSICFLCGDVMFSGDTLFAGDIGRCDLFSGNYQTMLQSLEKLKQLEVNYHVLPGHGPASTLEKEKERNPYMTGEAL